MLDNKYNKSILDLPYHILKDRIFHVENELEILDGICFSLTCKRFYMNRDRYLVFNYKYYPLKFIERVRDTASMKSYSHQYQQMIDSRLSDSQCQRMILFREKQEVSADIFSTYDYIEYYDENSEVAIPPNVHLPDSVTTLTFMMYDLNGQTIEPNTFPPAVKELDLSNLTNYKLTVGSIPSGVLELNLGKYHHVLEEGIVPHGVKRLTIASDHRNGKPLVAGSIPDSVEILHYSNACKIEPNMLPESIEILYLGFLYKHQLEHEVLPPRLKKFVWNSPINVDLEENILPPTISHFNVKKSVLYPEAIMPSETVETRLEIHLDLSYFKNNSLDDIPLAVQKFLVNTFTARRINDNTFLCLNRGRGGFTSDILTK
ncbi:hypothetical protein PPL_04887 [Heterostelium album PN500]|uniref:F-box domain-containing protein n=1 Tax=Heterostelium pallidum (strain ATCC 26659 / Pp 5 / PN500) TaxID=670386 RepID=D3B8U4_HETP5|nr:hypothetical protein PPL_04887 [Heterostelium album PN500]EFA82462.1 hypothetical protein PPL_04887 [Heterostelium album PN500]|eukprot:XP_020434579.1 hypothetical protein PPL_04887 [Heterostelium album PN500]